MGKHLFIKIACLVMTIMAGMGVVHKGWGLAANVVLEELDKVEKNPTDFSAVLADVVRVVDGDTIEVSLYGTGGDKEMLRLIGVDTPETVHPRMPVQFYGPEATQFTKNMCSGTTVKLHYQKQGPSRGNYGRLLVYVELAGGAILNEEIISNGFGYSYTKYPHEKTAEYNQLQHAAQASEVGLWGSVKFEDLPDWLRKSNPDILK